MIAVTGVVVVLVDVNTVAAIVETVVEVVIVVVVTAVPHNEFQQLTN